MRYLRKIRVFELSGRAWDDGDHNEHNYSYASLARNYPNPPRYWMVLRFMQSRLLLPSRPRQNGYLFPSNWSAKWRRVIRGKKQFPFWIPSQYRNK